MSPTTGLLEAALATLRLPAPSAEVPAGSLPPQTDPFAEFIALHGPRDLSISLQEKMPGGPPLQCQYCHDQDKNLLMRVFHQGRRVISVEVVLPEELAIEIPHAAK